MPHILVRRTGGIFVKDKYCPQRIGTQARKNGQFQKNQRNSRTILDHQQLEVRWVERFSRGTQVLLPFVLP